ncbi:MAG: hypothetical protein PHV18_11225 [Lachnospiraceae bacterium]|nr:hypothetical protein [Lachnospiraceae bacterium]
MKQNRTGRRAAMCVTAVLLSLICATTIWAKTKERLETVSDVYWDEDNTTVARWEEVEDAFRYEIYLYRDDSRVDTIKTQKTRFNLEKFLKHEGEYTFKVRALAKDKSKEFSDGYWSDLSDSIYIDEGFAELIRSGGTLDTSNSGPGALGETKVSKEISAIYTPEWQQDAAGWRYRLSDGTFQANGWWQDTAKGIWYYFNDQGYMVTGWIDWNGGRYYCLPSGAMVTGDTNVDGVTYHFDASGLLQNS